MVDIIISEINVNGATWAVSNNGKNSERASTLITCYTQDNKYTSELQYKNEIIINGIPLSTSIFFNSNYDPSNEITSTVNTYYTLNVIKNDIADPSNIVFRERINFVLNGNRLSSTRIDDKNYINIVESTNTPNSSNLIIFNGIPMATNSNNELLVNNSGYDTNDIDEYIEIHIGGIPLAVGRIGINYYLIVKVLDQNNT